jgi:hypothetical protein
MFIQLGAKWQMSFQMLPTNISLPQEAGNGHYFYVELVGAEEQPPVMFVVVGILFCLCRVSLIRYGDRYD